MTRRAQANRETGNRYMPDSSRATRGSSSTPRDGLRLAASYHRTGRGRTDSGSVQPAPAVIQFDRMPRQGRAGRGSRRPGAAARAAGWRAARSATQGGGKRGATLDSARSPAAAAPMAPTAISSVLARDEHDRRVLWGGWSITVPVASARRQCPDSNNRPGMRSPGCIRSLRRHHQRTNGAEVSLRPVRPPGCAATQAPGPYADSSLGSSAGAST
jgi:hypothetical protein